MNRDEKILFNIKPPKKEKIPGQLLSVEKQFISIKKYFIFMEGKTEFNYLTGLKRDFLGNNKKIELKLIEPESSSNNARTLLIKAEQYIKNKRKSVDLENDFNLPNITYDDEIIIIFDCDKNFDDKGKDNLTHAEYAKVIADKNKFRIIFSNYNIEVWILCHFKKPDKSCKSTGLIKQIKKQSGWERYRKNDKHIFDKLKDKLDFAIQNSKELLQEKNVPVFSKESNPVTEMGILIEEIISNV